MSVTKSLDEKLARIHADPHRATDFILADAKDADMALSIGAPGRSPERWPDGEIRHRTLAEFRNLIVEIVEQDMVDIMLMSASTSELLTIQQRLFDSSRVTPAARANDTTDIHIVRGGRYASQPSLPFRTATLDHIQCGKVSCKPEERAMGANLGLYSITFTNDAERDRANLEAYKAFRLEAEAKGFRHFLEVFDPNIDGVVSPEQLPGYINDCIVRALGGVTGRGRPDFLKIVYHGPRAMEELVRYDPHLVVGILGGAAGTTYDAFKLLAEAKKYGGRVALFGRKINNAEHQLAFIRFLRLIADGEVGPEEAVHAYHGTLQALGIAPTRPLAQDMELHTGVMNYAGTGKVISIPPTAGAAKPAPAKPAENSCGCTGTKPNACACDDTKPDFQTMTPAQKVAYHRERWNRILG